MFKMIVEVRYNLKSMCKDQKTNNNDQKKDNKKNLLEPI